MLRECTPITRDRKQMQSEAKEQNEQNAEPETRRREREKESGADQVIREFVPVRCCPNAHRDGNERAQNHRVDREEECHRDAPEDETVDRLPVQERGAEITPRDTG